MKPATLLIVVMAMSFFLLVLGGGGYFLTREKDDDEGEECTPEGLVDKNANYEIDEHGDCIFSKCKTGYTKEGDWCLPKTKDYYISGGIQSKDCVISGYTDGLCRNKVNHEVLTGYRNLYGEGYMDRYAIITEPATGNGKCDNALMTGQPCNVKRVAQCKAPQELWTSDDDTPCTAIFDGVREILKTNSGFCGVGTKVKTLKEKNSTEQLRGDDMTVEDYKESVNWDMCQKLQTTSCNVPCGDDDKPTGCPNVSDIGWQTDGKCYLKEDAEAFINNDKIYYTALKEVSPLTRDRAVELGAFNETAGGKLKIEKIPKGLQIHYLSGKGISTKELRDKGCSILYTTECIPPLVANNCTFAETLGPCTDHLCGQQQRRTFVRNVTKAAFGTGTCDIELTGYTSSGCTTVTKDCCDKNNKNHYTLSGDCLATGKGTFNYNSSFCSLTGSQMGTNSETLDCCYIGNWKDEGCNQDNILDHKKYTRTVLNGNLCTDVQLKQDVNTSDIFNTSSPKVKYVSDEANCKNDCTLTPTGIMSFSDHYQHVNNGAATKCDVKKWYKVTALAQGSGTCSINNVLGTTGKLTDNNINQKYCDCTISANESSSFAFAGIDAQGVCDNISHCEWRNGQCFNKYET